MEKRLQMMEGVEDDPENFDVQNKQTKPTQKKAAQKGKKKSVL